MMRIFFFFQAEEGIRYSSVTGVQTCALPICMPRPKRRSQPHVMLIGAFTQFDQHYMGLTPSFRARHASFQEIEELLLVQGVTPDLFYGSYSPDESGNLLPHAGLRDCLSVYGSIGQIDVNTMPPAVMQPIGIPPDLAAGIVNFRQNAPIRSMERVGGVPRLGIVPRSIATLRATARVRLSHGH